MSRPARTPSGAFGTTLAVLREARGSRCGSSDGRSTVTASPPATRRRQRERVPAGLLGGTLLVFALVADVHAQTRIGRLFSSLEQRIALDRLRHDSDIGKDAEQVVDRTGLESRPMPERGPSAFAVTFNGVAVRNDGHRVAWIDGVETAPGTTTSAGVRIEADRTPGGRLRIRLSDGRTSAVLEPGQAIDATGRVRKAYERRSTGLAAGIPGGRTADSDSGEVGEGAAAPVGSPEAVSPLTLPPNLVQDLLRGTRVDSAALGTGASDAGPAGDGPPKAGSSAGRESGKGSGGG